jgi:hypothetical protein
MHEKVVIEEIHRRVKDGLLYPTIIYELDAIRSHCMAVRDNPDAFLRGDDLYICTKWMDETLRRHSTHTTRGLGDFIYLILYRTGFHCLFGRIFRGCTRRQIRLNNFWSFK